MLAETGSVDIQVGPPYDTFGESRATRGPPLTALAFRSAAALG